MEKGTKKAVIFTRVSSKKQDTQRQINDLTPLAKEDGYKKSDIAVISHKESATKNDIQNRKSIRELQDLINTNHIECVYITEISRLARRNDVLYDILALLDREKICLVVQKPTLIRTIKKDGSKDLEADLIISFMRYLSVSESEIKLERQKSGMKSKIAEGRICTAKLIFGYKRTRDNFAIVDEEKAKVVRDIFDMYLNGNTIGQIWAKYKVTGYFSENIKKTSSEGRVIKILKDKTYIGENKNFQYPPIVSADLFQQVQGRLASRVSKKEVTKKVYLCKNLIHIQGRTMTPELAKVAYTFDNRELGKRYSININVIDSLAWNCACEALANMGGKEDKKRRKNAKETLKMLDLKLSNVDNIIKNLEEEKVKLNTMYQKGRLSDSDYDYRFEKVEEEIAHVQKEKGEMLSQQLQLKSFLESNKDTIKVVPNSYPLTFVSEDYQDVLDAHVNEASRYFDLLKIKDPAERQKLIKMAIKNINVECVEKGEYKIKFEYVDATLNDSKYYLYKVAGWKITLHSFKGNTQIEDLTGTWENRIKRPNQK